MLETQKNEYASGVIEIGNHAEASLHERTAEYSEEIQRLKHRAEAYVGDQNENISRLRQELANASAEIHQSNGGRLNLNFVDLLMLQLPALFATRQIIS